MTNKSPAAPQSKNLVLPHMSALTAIGAIITGGLTTVDRLKDGLAISTTIPEMKLKPEHVTEVTAEIDKQIESLQNNSTHNTALAGQFIDKLVEVSEEIGFNNQTKQNGAGAQDVHVDPATQQPAGATAA